MGMLRTLGPVVITAGSRTPVYTGPVVAAVSFSITNGIATIVLGAGNLPVAGYNGPNQAIASTSQSNDASYRGNGPVGQQVTLWGFTTATYFNGKVVTVLDHDSKTGAFRFYFAHANVSSANDAGNTAPAPLDKFRVVRIECSQSISTHIIYVGDLNVSSSQYAAALSLAGQIAFELAGDNIDASRIFVDGSNSGDTVQVSVVGG